MHVREPKGKRPRRRRRGGGGHAALVPAANIGVGKGYQKGDATVMRAITFSDALAQRIGKAQTLYDRLGGVFAIAAVVDHFSDALIGNPVVGAESKNPQLRAWHAKVAERLPGLKVMRTLWVCDITGGPFKFEATRPGKTRLGLEEAHRNLKISPAEFDEVAAELGRTLDHFKVPEDAKAQVLNAFAGHKAEVTAGYKAKLAR